MIIYIYDYIYIYKLFDIQYFPTIHRIMISMNVNLKHFFFKPTTSRNRNPIRGWKPIEFETPIGWFVLLCMQQKTFTLRCAQT